MKKYGKSALLGMVTGVATGVTIGYLTAPQSGKKTRQKLADTLGDQSYGFTAGIKNEWYKTIAMAQELVSNVKAEAGIFPQKTKQGVEEANYKTKSALQKEDLEMTYNDQVDEVANGVKAGVNKIEAGLKTS